MKKFFKNKKTLVSVLATLGIILTTLGITAAWFSYARNGTRENSISSGAITFIYEENENVGNGILLEDAMPMPDSYGKAQTNWFDFKVKSTSGIANIPYEITLRKTTGSDDIGDSVKVYLTKVNGNNEEEKVLSIYNSLANSTNEIASINNEKTLYKSSILAGAKNYTDNYRLRIWLNDNPSDGNVLSYEQTITQTCSDTTYKTKEDCEANHEQWLDVAQPATAKNFTVKVNVYANGSAATQEELADANSTGISDIVINGLEATENEDPNADYDFSLTTTNSNITIDIDTANSGATVEIEPYDPENPTAMNTKVRRLSTGKTFVLTEGDNYFKVTVTSANKANTKEYILKVHYDKMNQINLHIDNETTTTIYRKKSNPIGKIDTPIKDGYSLVGWYSDQSYTNKIDSNTIVTDSLTDLYAKWTKFKILGRIYSASTDGAAAVNAYGTQYQHSSSSMINGTNLDEFINLRYNNSWIVSTSANNIYYSTSDDVSDLSQWTKLSSLSWVYTTYKDYYFAIDEGNCPMQTIMLHIDNNTSSISKQVCYRIGNIDVVMPAGKTLLNWYTDSTLTNVINSSTIMSTSITDLYADTVSLQYLGNVYTVSASGDNASVNAFGTQYNYRDVPNNVVLNNYLKLRYSGGWILTRSESELYYASTSDTSSPLSWKKMGDTLIWGYSNNVNYHFAVKQ